ncbi:hypothetical protein D3C78_1225850 [compost metagenome]
MPVELELRFVGHVADREVVGGEHDQRGHAVATHSRRRRKVHLRPRVVVHRPKVAVARRPACQCTISGRGCGRIRSDGIPNERSQPRPIHRPGAERPEQLRPRLANLSLYGLVVQEQPGRFRIDGRYRDRLGAAGGAQQVAVVNLMLHASLAAQLVGHAPSDPPQANRAAHRRAEDESGHGVS